MAAMILADNSTTAMKGFRTYLNYLSAVRDRFRETFGSFGRYCEQCLVETRRLKGDRTLDRERIRRFLRLAWNTEHLLHESGSEDAEIQRLNNHWAPVQAYYAVYCAAEAAAYALDGSAPDSHAKALKKVTEYARRLDLPPWDVVCTGPTGKDGSDISVEGLPAGTEIPNNLQLFDVDAAGMIAKCVSAEHKHRIHDSWISRDRSGCYKYQFDPGPTGLLHFLYRLRIKANYREVDVFLAGATEREVLDFGRRLRFLVVLAVILCEIIVIRKIGKRAVLEFAKEYIDRNPAAIVLARRVEMYERLV